jgi:hypothetical protein
VVATDSITISEDPDYSAPGNITANEQEWLEILEGESEEERERKGKKEEGEEDEEKSMD